MLKNSFKFSIPAILCGLLTVTVATGCGDDDGDDGAGGVGGGGTSGGGTGGTAGTGGNAGGTGQNQIPPQGQALLQPWLAAKSYEGWNCEEEKHPNRSPSPHGVNRICSNDKLSGHGTGEYPVGSASVKELYNGDGIIGGYAVAIHDKAGTDGGSWYWYEMLPGGTVVADGHGDAGGAMSICVDCHMGAGSDADHSGHDFVYTQVP